MTWFLALLGIAISFFIKYANRTSKKKSWSPLFWIKDNWPETFVSVLATIVLLIIFKKTEFDSSSIADKIPWIISLPMDYISALLAGYLNTQLFYALFKTKKK